MLKVEALHSECISCGWRRKIYAGPWHCALFFLRGCPLYRYTLVLAHSAAPFTPLCLAFVGVGLATMAFCIQLGGGLVATVPITRHERVSIVSFVNDSRLHLEQIIEVLPYENFDRSSTSIADKQTRNISGTFQELTAMVHCS